MLFDKELNGLKFWDQVITMSKKYPQFKHGMHLDKTVSFNGVIVSTLTGNPFEIKIILKLNYYPSTYIINPVIRNDCPHLNYHGTICLFDQKKVLWQNHWLIAENLMPRIPFWLVTYETWLETGLWLADEAID